MNYLDIIHWCPIQNIQYLVIKFPF
jgi:hypothetical protein